jgi:acyl carrier protein
LDGGRVLLALLQGRVLDFCLLCSSLSPILGGLGFAAYAAANACLDALALEHNRRHPGCWTSVNWEGWRFEAEIAPHQPGGSVAELGLTPDQGMEAFDRILSAPLSDRVVISTGDLDERIRRWVQMDSPPLAQPESGLRPRPAMLSAYIAPTGETALEVARLWESLLGIAGISAEDSFFELGGNSLLLTQLLAQIRKRFRLELSLTALFERPTIADIAELIELAQRPVAAGERDEGFL